MVCECQPFGNNGLEFNAKGRNRELNAHVGQLRRLLICRKPYMRTFSVVFVKTGSEG